MIPDTVRLDDLAREVYGVFGIPVDLIDMSTVLRRIEGAAIARAPFLISTANLNFLVASRYNTEFRDSLLLSELCTADGMPIIWIARLLGLPIKERIAGSDIFDALKSAQNSSRQLKAFMFGGPDGVADAACQKLNAEPGAMICVGSFYPGFGSVDEMSADPIIDTLNSSGADLLVVALGAKKGQTWLLRNYDRLQIPIRVHLGAAINFQAGTVKRAPIVIQNWGLEWLWRIKEEPHLWGRYCKDAMALLQLMLTRVAPLVILTRWHRLRWGRKEQDLLITRSEDNKSVTLTLNGAATACFVNKAAPCFRDALTAGKPVAINFADTHLIDARFVGLLLMLNKQLKRRQLPLTLTEVPPRIERVLRLNGFGFLLRQKA
jgi:N-acetylglucosaminyldiphosphoundecaprenol N-acetyl-beta-D-mannosaminyltransferase